MSAPLTSLKILDFSTLLPGPYATMMLADLGAEVLRIEAPGRPDLMRLLPPFDQNGVSAGHGTLNRSKRSLGLNLKAGGALEIIQNLITKQDYNIIVEQMRPGVMDRLGVGYEALKAICPDIIYCSLTGYGQTGPMRDRAGHDLNYLALSGMLGHYGRNEDQVGVSSPPPPLPTQVADIGAGSMHLVIGLLSAVIRRTATGEGGHVDISMHDGSVAWNTTMAAETLMNGISAEPERKPLNGGTFYDLYETADGKLLSVGSLEPKFWKQFCNAIKRDDLFMRGLNFDIEAQQALKPEICAAIKSKTLAEWEIIFADYDACVEPVLSTQEALDSVHVRERGMVVDVAGQQQIGTPIRMTGFSAEYKHVGAKLGVHTHQILQSLGYTDDKINQLLQNGVVAGDQS